MTRLRRWGTEVMVEAEVVAGAEVSGLAFCSAWDI